jgi:hypothetical protein
MKGSNHMGPLDRGSLNLWDAEEDLGSLYIQLPLYIRCGE